MAYDPPGRSRFAQLSFHHPGKRAMSLVQFHRILIALGILFCLGYATWEFASGGRPLIGAAFVVLGIGLFVYLRKLNRFLGLGDMHDGGYDAEK
jgi:hypothetical protein